MNKGKIWQWIAAAFCFASALIFLGVSSIFFILAGILFMPTEKIRKFLLEKVKIKTWLACTLAGIMFFVGAGTISGLDEVNSGSLGDSSSGINNSIVVDDEENSSSSQMHSSKNSSKPSSGKESAPPDDDSSSSSLNSSSKNSSQGSTKPVTVTYVLNTSTKKIHKQTCYLVAKISSKNKQTTTTALETLLSQGYTKCLKCF